MDELLGQITTAARGMWIYRRVAMLTTWLVGAIGVGVVLLMPDYYQASARVFVDTQSILRPLMTGIAVQPNIEQQVSMLSRTLINRPTVERLVRIADLDLGSQSKASTDAVVDSVTKSISIQSTGRDNLYTLSYRNASPEKAQRVVQALLTIFVESSLGAARQDSDSARRFLDEQIKSYEAKLTEAEGRLKAFKLRNIEMQSQSGLDSAGRAAEIDNQLSQARLDLREAESARAAAGRQLEILRSQAAKSTAGSAPDVQTPELDARIYAQKRNLDTLLQRYTDEHPDVVRTRFLIADLEAQKRREVEALRRKAQEGHATPAAETNPAILELSRIYSAAEVQVASLRARVVEYESRSRRIHEQLKVAPQLEAELAQLNRDYQVNQKNYADLVARRESALMSGKLENTSNVAEFRVIDPPRVAPKPVAPNRLLLMPISLLAAIGAGLGMAFVMSQVRPVFFDGAALRQVTQLPLLGVVGQIASDESRRRESRSLMRFVMACVAFLLLYAGGMAALSIHSGVLG
ncbi:chain-length determining protein [Alicycliphilus denitrificans]|uniref:XrtA system polysaccharide chain length determinant n=1 Tax=Alicycliphilus denitrificans TaxID=179636 RepID=UPI0009668581|nr:XrtA system polysaccharide chain length determinant [Alicycliphilus denitrificans]MBN9575822.1 chain length-determining protein [Alicycliphilus denitrificans]OJW81252.1 MAG: chain length-determining protein [Alicycliphilus sp. 69-12]BCN37462.1 chain-length determining protein [Alicycliphilus denitrificans]